MVEGARRATGTIPSPEAVADASNDMTNTTPSEVPAKASKKKRRFLSAEKKFEVASKRWRGNLENRAP